MISGDKATRIIFPGFLNTVGEITYTPEHANEEIGDGHWSLNIKEGRIKDWIQYFVDYARELAEK